jgi:hypothetical protein
VLDVVEADERDVPRDIETALAECLGDADHGDVVDGEDRRRRLAQREQRKRRVVGDTRVDRARLDEVLRPKGDAGLLERLPVSLFAIPRRRDLPGLGHHCDSLVPEPNQVLDQAPRPGDAVALHEVAVVAAQRAVDEHERDAVLPHDAEVGPRALPHRRDQEALDLEGEHVLEIPALALDVGLRVTEDHVVAGAPGDLLRAAYDEGEERVGDIGDDQSDRPGPATGQAAREAVRDVARLGDGSLDSAARILAHAAVVDHARDRHRGNARLRRDLSHRHPHAAHSSSGKTPAIVVSIPRLGRLYRVSGTANKALT